LDIFPEWELAPPDLRGRPLGTKMEAGAEEVGERRKVHGPSVGGLHLRARRKKGSEMQQGAFNFLAIFSHPEEEVDDHDDVFEQAAAAPESHGARTSASRTALLAEFASDAHTRTAARQTDGARCTHDGRPTSNLFLFLVGRNGFGPWPPGVLAARGESARSATGTKRATTGLQWNLGVSLVLFYHSFCSARRGFIFAVTSPPR
jgi:hypothetical protein